MENQESSYLLKMVEQIKSGTKGEPNGVQNSSLGFVGRGEKFAMSFDFKEVTDLVVEGINFDNQHKLPNGGSAQVADRLLKCN